VALVAVLYAARQYYRNWGATKEECLLQRPGDELIGDPVVQVTQAVYIDSPQSTVWALLAQLGQDRGDADRIRPESQRLELGDVVRLAPRGWMGLKDGLRMCVAEIEPEKHIVAQRHASETAAGRGVVDPYPAALGGPCPAPCARTDRLAPPGRSVCHGAGQAAGRVDDAQIFDRIQTSGRAAGVRAAAASSGNPQRYSPSTVFGGLRCVTPFR
jgi:hypothetical protein